MGDYQNIQLSFQEDIPVVRLTPRQGVNLENEPFDELLDFVTTNCPTKLMLDFSCIEFFSPTPARSGLFGTFRYLKDRGGQLKLFGLRAPVAEVFGIMRLDQLFQIYATEVEAFQAFKDDE